jgi:hypothetical protein
VDGQIPPLRGRYSVDRSSLELVSCVFGIALPGFAACIYVCMKKRCDSTHCNGTEARNGRTAATGELVHLDLLACVMFMLWLSRSYRKAEVLSSQGSRT